MNKLAQHTTKIFWIIALLLTTSVWASEQRFPKPDFESGYQYPEAQYPAPASVFLETFDLILFAALMALTAWLILKKRSRKGVFWVSIFSLIYFGFFREGCVCAVGSLQNIALGLFSESYTVPLVVVGFFLLPIVFTLLYGRVFCASVCPLGAIQDLVIVKPMTLPLWLRSTLAIFPVIYLALAIVFAATGADFIICRYDPFVGFFRLGATLPMMIFGVILLVTGTIIARPYCRFICPYGVILKWASYLSFRHLTITPKDCINCRLCESSCPFEAINEPTSEKTIRHSVNRFLINFLITPLLTITFAVAGYFVYPSLASIHPSVKLLNEIKIAANNPQHEISLELESFRGAGITTEMLETEVQQLLSDFKTGAILAGIFIGLVIGLTIVSLSQNKHRTGYTPDRANCLSCGRCMDFCPVKNE